MSCKRCFKAKTSDSSRIVTRSPMSFDSFVAAAVPMLCPVPTCARSCRRDSGLVKANPAYAGSPCDSHKMELIMIVEQIWTGNAYRNFHYLIACSETGEALAIDPLDHEKCLARAKTKVGRSRKFSTRTNTLTTLAAMQP